MFHRPSEKLEGGKEELITTLIYLNWSPPSLWNSYAILLSGNHIPALAAKP